MVKRSNKSVNVIRVLQAIAEYPDRVSTSGGREVDATALPLSAFPPKPTCVAPKQLIDIKQRIKTGTFKFEDEFPHYRFKGALPTANDSKPDEEAREEKKPQKGNRCPRCRAR
jgi:hypothetical protein